VDGPPRWLGDDDGQSRDDRVFRALRHDSDEVFAIAMTILVFDLKLPVTAAVHSDAELLTALRQLAPKMVSYFLSFMTLGIFWVGQGAQLHFAARYDRNLVWISLLFLGCVSLIPFSTGVLSQSITLRSAVVCYWLNILALGLALLAHWKYLVRHGCVNADATELREIDGALTRRIIIAQTLYAGSAALCLVSASLSVVLFLLIQLNFASGLLGAPPRVRPED
jgi:uncharacterized membrane protein